MTTMDKRTRLRNNDKSCVVVEDDTDDDGCGAGRGVG